MSKISKKLLILGAGQYGRVIKELAQETGNYSMIAFLDDKTSESVLGKLNDYHLFTGIFEDAVVAIGNPVIRLKWLKVIEEKYNIPVIVHPKAYISPSAVIDHGTIVEPFAVVHTSVKVGFGCIISAGAIINHNSVLEDGVHCDCGSVIPARTVVKTMRKIVQGETYFS